MSRSNDHKNAKQNSDLSDAEVVAMALNEQGFLFQQKVLETIGGSSVCKWYTRALEYPVSFGPPGAFETKIDMVLCRRASGRDPWNLVIECKRANRDYKRWIFFDRSPRLTGIGVETMFCQFADLGGTWDQSSQPLPPLMIRNERLRAHQECPIFNFYVEARRNRPTSGQRCSATEAIEEAMRQVSYGLIGLGGQLHQMKTTSYRLVPIIVTSAELLSAEFNPQNISLTNGLLEHQNLMLTSRRWLGVNYRIDDSVAHYSGLTTNIPSNAGEAVWTKFVRTVFVVQSNHLLEFLDWVDYWITDS